MMVDVVASSSSVVVAAVALSAVLAAFAVLFVRRISRASPLISPLVSVSTGPTVCSAPTARKFVSPHAGTGVSTRLNTTHRMYTPSSRVLSSRPIQLPRSSRAPFRTFATIAEGVEFDVIAREWRMKWSADDNKTSLVEVQKLVDPIIATLKQIDGVKSVQRVVCGDCQDYKLVTAVDMKKYGDWADKGFAPEAEFLDAAKKIPGITTVETQTYTLLPLTDAVPTSNTDEATIADGVKFSNIAREWRMKWSPDNDKQALVDAQRAVDKHIDALKATPGFRSLQRIVCGDCNDFKVVTTLSKEAFDAFADGGFGPEQTFLDEVTAIPGIGMVETQTYTLTDLS